MEFVSISPDDDIEHAKRNVISKEIVYLEDRRKLHDITVWQHW